MKRRFLVTMMAVCVLASSLGIEVMASGVELETVVEQEIAEETAEQLTEETAAEEQLTEEQPAEETAEEQPAEELETGTLNFVYMEKETVDIPGQQQLLISVGEDNAVIQNAELFYHRTDNGESFQAAAGEISGNAVLFSLEYQEAGQAGVYVLDKVLYETEAGQRCQVDLTAEKEMKYGVGQEVEADPDAVILDEAEAAAGKVEMNVVTFDENGNQESELSIADALGNAGAEVIEGVAGAAAVAGMGSAGVQSGMNVRNTRAARSMVIVLDPGHGGYDGGASRTYNGVTYIERDIVLKIANYCKTELEKYAGVQVYLTRTDNTSPLMDRRQRTDFALSKGADVIISFHINATGKTLDSASGSLVYGPNTDTASGVISQELAKKILEKLAELGLRNRGIVVEEGLGMVKYPKESGVPGILIEHAFVNNAGDVANYLSSDAKLAKLGAADAAAIAEYYKLQKKSGYKTYEAGAGSLTVKANSEKTKYTASVSGVPDAYGVRCAVWNETNGQDDLVWYDAKKDSKGVWKASFSISSFKKEGKYQIHAYVVNPDGSTACLATSSVKLAGPSAKKIEVQSIKNEKGTFRVRITGLKSDAPIEEVTVKAWSQSDKKDTYTYTAKLQKDGTYLATVNIKKHKYNYGTYQVYVYARDKNGITKRLAKKTATLKRPSLNIAAKANKSQTKYTISADAALGITDVRMAVWSKTKGQDDLKWYTAKKGNDGRLQTSVSISDHKTAGTYYVHIYGKTVSGQNIFLGGAAFTVKAPTIKSVEVRKKNAAAGTFYVYVKDVQAKAGVSKVKVKAWTGKDKKDSYTYTAKEVSDGTYRIKVNIKNHSSNYGDYQIAAYVTDKRGITVSKKITQEFLAPAE